MNKINIGCGMDVKEGWVNLDKHKRNGADVIFDLSDILKGKKLPFKDNKFNYVLCSHVLEDFINPVPIMDELVRIINVNGIIEIRVPYETCNWGSIYHQKPFNIMTFFSYIINDNYEEDRPLLRVKKVRFYTRPITLRSLIWSPIHIPRTILLIGLFNLLTKVKYDFVDRSVIKAFAQGDFYLKVQYEKYRIKQKQTFLERLIFRIRM